MKNFNDEMEEGEVILMNKKREIIMRVNVEVGDTLAQIPNLANRKIGGDKENIFIEKYIK